MALLMKLRRLNIIIITISLSVYCNYFFRYFP